MPNHVEYVVWSDLVFEESEWENSEFAEKYDDIIRCTVDLDHPDYDEETYEGELISWWTCGIKPPFVV